MRKLLAGLFICWSTFLPAQTPVEQKCSPTLLSVARALEQADDRSANSQKRLFTVVVTDLPGFLRWMLQNGLTEYGTYAPAGVILLEDSPKHFMETTLLRPEVAFADLGALTGREELPVPGHNLFVNSIPCVHARWPALDGAGTTISIKEFRFDSLDVDLKNRCLPNSRSAATITAHASTMASLAAGAGTSHPQGRGVARGSRLVSSSFVGLMPDPDADYDSLDITVQNHSYGVDIENYYGAGALAYDENMQHHPGLLHVFSSGNQGMGASTSGTYANLSGFANLTGNFKMAKNVLLVGAVDSFNQVVSFSSRGPAYDGRVKPDLVAFGHDGTSEAAALVSGSAAVIRQAFFERYGYWPSSALLRTILIGSADDLGSPGPDFRSGYGNLNLKKAVEGVRDQFLAEGEVSHGETREFSIELPPQAGQFKITLAWNDVPALPNAARSLVNDLDLIIQAPDGTSWRPWVLNASPHPDSLLLPARQGRDSVNTLEQVSIVQPMPGLYRVLVQGENIPVSDQQFALSGHWDTLQHFTWTCPLRRDPAQPGMEAVLRWENTFTTEKGQLDWKPAGSTTWQNIDTAVVLNTGYKRWLVPVMVTPAQVRMRIDGSDFISDTFLLAPELRVGVGFNCADSFLLQWPRLAVNLTYRVWGLGDQYLEPLLTTTDTSVVLQKSLFSQHHFAVSALTPDNTAEGTTSGATDIYNQAVGCYINNLLAYLNINQVELTLHLGSLYGVRQVHIEQWQHNTWVVLYRALPSALDLFFTDPSPIPGTNLYRAQVVLENGGIMIGEPVTVYFAGENGYLLLPNPAISGEVLSVLAHVTDGIPYFMLFNALGQLLLKRELDDVRVDISLPALPPGYYAWMVVEAGASARGLYRGKLLVRR